MLSNYAKMSHLKITSSIPNQFVGSHNELAVTPINVTLGEKSLSLPEIAANNTDVKCFDECDLKPDLKLIQFIRRSYHVSDLDYSKKIKKITEKYSELREKFPSAISNFHFQYPMKQHLGKHRRKTLEKIQVNAGAEIISAYESNRTQSTSDFETEMLESRDNYDQNIISPSLDMGITDEGLFDDKLDVLIRKFKRFNVIYRSTNKYHDNWVTLSERISGKNSWVHVVGLIPLQNNKLQKISNLSRVFLFGVHSASQGFAWMPITNNDTILFNPKTMCYEASSLSMTYEESRVKSFMKQQNEFQIAKQHMINKTYFSKYVPSKKGLVYSLIEFS